MLNLTWMPTVLRNQSDLDVRQFRQPLRRPLSGASTTSNSSGGSGGCGCLGHCTAPSPVSSQQSGPSGPSTGSSIGAAAGSGPGGSLAALLNATQPGGPIVVGDDDFCAYCQDVCLWFELASLLCHHLAPASPPALPRLELSVAAISTFLTKPGEFECT